ncbi:kinase-like domain-containing protein [Chytriomyces sp. MP71]|nr:kinase-like domain-containing protein [Chytriomyces sp. MP71]
MQPTAPPPTESRRHATPPARKLKHSTKNDEVAAELVAELAAIQVAAIANFKRQPSSSPQPTTTFLELSNMLKHKYKLISVIKPPMTNTEIFLAYDEEKKTDVALKVVPKASLSEYQKWRVFRETGLLHSLSHPNIIRLLDFYDTKTCYITVLEYMKDGDLFDLLKQTGPLAPEKVKIIAAQIALGLEYLHSKKVIHRDVKLENIAIVRSPAAVAEKDSQDNLWMKAKLIDFGLSVYSKSGRSKTPCGTLGYMAPEMIFVRLHECDYTAAVDMVSIQLVRCMACSQDFQSISTVPYDQWAFGCLLYSLLSGGPPFEMGVAPTNELDFIVHYPSQVWSSIPILAKEAVQACLDSNPASRITACDFLKLAWFQEGTDSGSEDERDRNIGTCDPLSDLGDSGSRGRSGSRLKPDRGASSDNADGDLWQPRPVSDKCSTSVTGIFAKCHTSLDTDSSAEGGTLSEESQFYKPESPPPAGWIRLPDILRPASPGVYAQLKEIDRTLRREKEIAKAKEMGNDLRAKELEGSPLDLVWVVVKSHQSSDLSPVNVPITIL